MVQSNTQSFLPSLNWAKSSINHPWTSDSISSIFLPNPPQIIQFQSNFLYLIPAQVKHFLNFPSIPSSSIFPQISI
ncbi:hypothetical protein L1987_14444 [Smallanthus sonchifolius]|uniref:Uncharacterized protein n=1 Tax=Smallanthus sonchifolius TaxID=185202 RepID=A0ACB9J3C6_9ASTR|nr:hypothetical protein L1987_14444 [Smallanthus sonchifolius]